MIKKKKSTRNKKIYSYELKKSIHTLKEWGLRVKLGENIFSEYNHLMFKSIYRSFEKDLNILY